MPRDIASATRAMTLPEALIVTGIILILVVLLLPPSCPDRRLWQRLQCENNLEQIGRGFAAYYGQYDDYYPFVDSPYATDSLTLLYPDFVEDVSLFRCPSTKDAPEISLRFIGQRDGSGLYRRGPSWFGDAKGLAMERPKWSSYGYDERIDHMRAGANHVLAGDMDASFASGKGRTSNHKDGGNFLRFDGHVSFEATIYCSNNPLDNIFARNDWAADTDAWIRRP